jgi:hypothetical protein
MKTVKNILPFIIVSYLITVYTIFYWQNEGNHWHLSKQPFIAAAQMPFFVIYHCVGWFGAITWYISILLGLMQKSVEKTHGNIS